MYSEVPSQFRELLQAQFGEEYPRIVETITDRTVPSPVEGYIPHTVASNVAEVAGALVERKLNDVFRAPDQCTLRGGLVDLIKLVLETRLCTIVVLGTAPGDPPASPADRPAQVLPTGTDHNLQV